MGTMTKNTATEPVLSWYTEDNLDTDTYTIANQIL